MIWRYVLKSSVLYAVLGLSVGALFAGQPPVVFEEPLSPRIANYAIDVRLEPDSRMLRGQQDLTWVNKSGVEIEELQFHLYLNGFRNSLTTFMQESGGRMRGAAIDEDGWGFIEVDQVILPGVETIDPDRLTRYRSLPRTGEVSEDEGDSASADESQPSTAGVYPLNQSSLDLTARMEFLRPDDGNSHDFTVFRLELPEPLAAGAAIVLRFEFHAQLPTPPFARTGAKEEYFFVGQWFPKIAVFTGEEWNCHQFHHNSEFFADFGVYDVDITVPNSFIVGATGQEYEQIAHDGETTTHRYHAEDVHDFAWTASPDYVVFETQADDVAVRVLMQKDNLSLAQVHLDAAETAISFFQSRWGDYPFPNLTVVDPRRGAGGSGGMEYPTLITAGSSRFELPGVAPLMVEGVITHEFGHNYWYHLLASNEFEESWLDEGINTYTDIRVSKEAYEPRYLYGLDIDMQAVTRFYLMRSLSDPVKTDAWKFVDRRSYSTNSYSRPGVVLETLRGYLGADRMNEVMRTYVERWRFRHPTTEDFIAVANDVSGEDLGWFFDQAIYGTERLDYAVDRVVNRKVEERGYDLTRSATDPWLGESGFSTVETEESDLEGPEDTEDSEDGEEEDPDGTLYESSVVVRRLGDFVFPVTLQVVFDDGTVAERQWDGVGKWRRFEWEGEAKMVSATVDPEGLVLLDDNRLNNSHTSEVERAGIDGFSQTLRFWAEVALDFLSL